MKKCEKCGYRTRVKGTCGETYGCGYLLYTNKRRGCSVEDCEHWKDKGVSGKDKQTSAFNNTDLGKSRIGKEIGLERGFWEKRGMEK